MFFLQHLPCRASIGVGILLVGKPVFREYALPGTGLFVEVLYYRHVGLDLFIIAEKKIVAGSVLTVGNHGFDLGGGIRLVRFDERAHFVSLIDRSRSHFHRGDDFMKRINGSMRLIPELRLTPAWRTMETSGSVVEM